MPTTRPILRVGLTGGIASGKSTVARRLSARGAFVVDMDPLSHQVMEPDGPAYAPIVARFGESILDAQRRIDRTRLGPIVFADPGARADLEGIVHPAVRAEAARRIETAFRAVPPPPFAVVDAALLVETGMWSTFDALIVVYCRPSTQLSRLLARDGLDESEARRRIAAQAPTRRKLAVADFAISSEQPIEAMLAEVDATFDTLSRRAAERPRPADGSPTGK